MDGDSIKKSARVGAFLRTVTGLLLGAEGTETLVETINTTASINNLLLAGVERVAGRANVQAQIAASRTGLEFVTTRALYSDFVVVWVNTFFHGQPQFVGRVAI